MMTTLVTGATGMLGREVMLQAKGSALPVDRSCFDLENPDAVYDYLVSIKPNVILHLAAETDVDLCERQPRIAGVKNHLATAAIASAARDCGAYLVYVSSSNVFGADNRLRYLEIDAPRSCNYYGNSKLMGENEVRAILPTTSLVVRAGWMIGGGPEKDHKFVGKIVEQIRKGSTGLRAVSDKLGALTSAGMLGQFLLWAIENKPTGLLHYASQGIVSRFEIALFIAEYFKFSGTVTPVISSEFPLSALRPLSEYIESIYLDRMGNAPIASDWRNDLRSYLETFE